MAQKVRATVTLQLPAGGATPAPPVGTALGPHGINIVEFTKSYNEKTADRKGEVIPAVITIFEDRSFTFILKTPPAADMIRKAAGIEKGAGDHKAAKAGKITKAQVAEIAQKKMTDLNATSLEAACKMIEGSARSMGVEIVA
jgi:large subunit ribosomal protein L11